MVRLEEVEDEEFIRAAEAKSMEDDEGDYTDTDSEVSEEDEDELGPESLSDRLSALQDMIPPGARRHITSTVSTTFSYAKTGLWWGGKAAWVVTTSALLLGIPYALSLVEEQQYAEMEKEERMRSLGNEVMAPGMGGDINAQGSGEAKPVTSL